jgi:four helix bundle protein
MRYEKKRANGGLNTEVFNSVFEAASEIVEEIVRASKDFPRERIYLADLVCRHSKLVCVNLEEAWRMKEHGTMFLDKLSDAAQAASKTQDVLRLASKSNYINCETFRKIDAEYESIFEDIFAVLCNGKKLMNKSRGNGKREHAYAEIVSVG